MQAFPKEANFSETKPIGYSSKPHILRFRSDNTSYGASDTIRIEIPTNRNGHLLFPKDSYLEGKVQITAVTSSAAITHANLDQSVFSLFSRMRVLHGSNVLEDTLNCGRLWTVLYDLQRNATERLSDTIGMLVEDAPSGTFNSATLGKLALSTIATANTIGTNPVLDWSFNIPSAILGSLAQKCIPLEMCSASSLVLELELNPANMAFVTYGAGVITNIIYSVSDIYYNAKVSALDGEVNNLLKSSLGSSINLPAVTYKTDLKSIATGSSTFSDKFSFQKSSLKNFIFWLHNSTSFSSYVARSVSARTKANIQEYWLSINGEHFPSENVKSTSRMYQELLRAYDMQCDMNNGGIISYSNYASTNANLDSTAGDAILSESNPNTTVIQKRFVAGIDLDRFNMSGDVIMSGTNTVGQQLSLDILFSAATSSNLTLIGACLHDVIYNIQDGLITAKF
jgi:hypothetical protein